MPAPPGNPLDNISPQVLEKAVHTILEEKPELLLMLLKQFQQQGLPAPATPAQAFPQQPQPVQQQPIQTVAPPATDAPAPEAVPVEDNTSAQQHPQGA